MRRSLLKGLPAVAAIGRVRRMESHFIRSRAKMRLSRDLAFAVMMAKVPDPSPERGGKWDCLHSRRSPRPTWTWLSTEMLQRKCLAFLQIDRQFA